LTAAAWLSLGLHLQRAGRLAEAEALYRKVLESDPDNAEALHLFGVLAHQAGQPHFALEAISLALSHCPERADFHCNIGEIYWELQHHRQARHHLMRAVELDAGNAAAHNNLGLVLQALGEFDEAAAAYQKALELEPGFPEAHNNLGNAWKDLRQPDRAEASYRQALAVRPAYPEALHNLGNLLRETGRQRDARAQFEAALAVRPDYPLARFGLTMAHLPVVYRDDAEIDERRTAYRQTLAQLADYVRFDAGDAVKLSEAIGAHQPFFLAYQGRNDRELQATYGGMVAGAMLRRFPETPAFTAPRAGEPIRVGLVSGYFCNHSVWKLPLRGWLSQLDRRRFEVYGYHTRSQRDGETREAERLADRFVQGPLPLDQWRRTILADAPHVLLYPELGMDPVTMLLATQRLARIQATALGHPTTSGLPTIDYFLSSDLMEPADAQDHYSETLVRLPHLSVHYEPQARPAMTASRAEFGLEDGQVVYWCCQSLYKYLPRYDCVFARIARAVGSGCRFIFIGYQTGEVVSEIFRQRLEAAFAGHGLSAAAHCRLLPRLSPSRFLAVSAICDVFLDSIGWSGFNSTLEAGVNDLPVVTLPGDLMRGRHSMAVLRMMGVTATIASSLDDYVGIAARLGNDPGWRAAVSRQMAAGKHRAYRDPACTAALEDFLEESARSNGLSPKKWTPG